MSRNAVGAAEAAPKPSKNLPSLLGAWALRAGLLEHPVGLDVALVLRLVARLLVAGPLAVAVSLDVAFVLGLVAWLLVAGPLAVAVCLDVVVRRRRLLVLFHCSSFLPPDLASDFAY